MTPELAHVESWIFDLDNSLYPHSCNLFELIDQRMGAYIQRLLGLDAGEARRVQKGFFHAHGTTLAGLMANHGVLACGRSVAEAYDRLYYFERACQVQLYAMWTGRPLKEVPAHIVARTLRQYAESPSYGGKPACEHHFAALKRLLDRTEPDYAE